MCAQESSSLFRLRVVADADPAALTSVLGRFQNLNIIPRQVIAELGSNDTLHIVIDILGLTDAQLALIANKVREAPSIVNAYWHRI
jgi:hypothetical protein